MKNIFSDMPVNFEQETFEDLLVNDNFRVEKILSYGQSSPDEGWYDQEEHEWVILLSGYGVIEFEDGRNEKLLPGSYLHIQAHEKHKVVETSQNEVTVWLAIFYR